MNTYGYVGGNPVISYDPLGLAELTVDPGTSKYIQDKLNNNLDALEYALINNTATCPQATERFLDMFFDWKVRYSNVGSKNLHGKTDPWDKSTTFPK